MDTQSNTVHSTNSNGYISMTLTTFSTTFLLIVWHVSNGLNLLLLFLRLSSLQYHWVIHSSTPINTPFGESGLFLKFTRQEFSRNIFHSNPCNRPVSPSIEPKPQDNLLHCCHCTEYFVYVMNVKSTHHFSAIVLVKQSHGEPSLESV